MPLLIFIYSMMGLLICKYEPSQCRISDTQVNVKACGPLFNVTYDYVEIIKHFVMQTYPLFTEPLSILII